MGYSMPRIKANTNQKFIRLTRLRASASVLSHAQPIYERDPHIYDMEPFLNYI